MLKEMYSSIMTNPASKKLSPAYFLSSSTLSNQGSSPSQDLSDLDDATTQPYQSRADLTLTHGFRHQHVTLYNHADFLTEFGDENELEGAVTKDGTNVMLTMYRNVKFMF